MNTQISKNNGNGVDIIDVVDVGVPGRPMELEPVDMSSDTLQFLSNVYIMTYRHGGNIASKTFYYPGVLRDAIARAKNHCILQNYRFIILRPFLSNLESDEKQRENGITI